MGISLNNSGVLANFANGGGNVSVKLVVNQNALAKRLALLKTAQTVVDNSVINYCAIYAPKKTGALISSATVSQGGGKIFYGVPYARSQYYLTKTYRSYNAQKGGMWFERMKMRHKNVILQSAANTVGAKAEFI